VFFTIFICPCLFVLLSVWALLCESDWLHRLVEWRGIRMAYEAPAAKPVHLDHYTNDQADREWWLSPSQSEFCDCDSAALACPVCWASGVIRDLLQCCWVRERYRSMIDEPYNHSHYKLKSRSGFSTGTSPETQWHIAIVWQTDRQTDLLWLIQRVALQAVRRAGKQKVSANAVVTSKIKLFQNYFSLCRRPSEIILF